MWLWTHNGGLIPVIDMVWKRSCRASWNTRGMCLRIRPGTPFRPGALWFGVRRRASSSIAGVMHLKIIGTVCRRLGVMWESHGNGAPGGSVGQAREPWFQACGLVL